MCEACVCGNMNKIALRLAEGLGASGPLQPTYALAQQRAGRGVQGMDQAPSKSLFGQEGKVMGRVQCLPSLWNTKQMRAMQTKKPNSSGEGTSTKSKGSRAGMDGKGSLVGTAGLGSHKTGAARNHNAWAQMQKGFQGASGIHKAAPCKAWLEKG